MGYLSAFPPRFRTCAMAGTSQTGAFVCRITRVGIIVVYDTPIDMQLSHPDRNRDLTYQDMDENVTSSSYEQQAVSGRYVDLIWFTVWV